MVDQKSCFLFQPMPHIWYNKGHGMCYPICAMVHIKDLLLLIGKSIPSGGSRIPLSLSLSLSLSLPLSAWSFTICPVLNNCK